MLKEKIVIIGGGAIGSAIAYFLAVQPRFQGSITVLERDPSYAQASSALSASAIRQQFSTAVNIAISQFGIAFLRQAASLLALDGAMPDIALQERGYLYLASVAGVDALRAKHALQSAHGVQAALLEPVALRRKFPWLNCDDLALASLGLAGEGWFDGYALLMALRQKARSLGVTYLQAEAGALLQAQGRVTGVRLADGASLACDWAVNAAGAWARPLLAGTGFELPVVARRRCVFVLSSPARTPDCPLLIDPSGFWLRPEGRYWIAGMPPAPDADNLPLEVDYREFDMLWPLLAARVPGFQALRLESAWAGYYEYNTFDQNAILGPHPLLPNLLLANGFSGHGLQQAPAVGRGLAEWITEGGYRSLDLSALSTQRIVERRPLLEQNII